MAGFAALVLAAGAGARFGGGKLLAPWGPGVLLDAALAAAFAGPSHPVIVVTGCDAERVETTARAFADLRREKGRLTLVRAAGHAEGLSASLRAGLAAVPPEAEGVFVFLADMPKVPPTMARRLAGAIGDRLAAAPVFEGRRGHPVLLRRALFPRLESLEGDRGAGAVLAGLGEDLVLVETDHPGVVFDVDTPGDLSGQD